MTLTETQFENSRKCTVRYADIRHDKLPLMAFSTRIERSRFLPSFLTVITMIIIIITFIIIARRVLVVLSL